MAIRAEPNRRRLTVSHGIEGQGDRASSAAAEETNGDQFWNELFTTKRAVSIRSVLDKDDRRKTEFFEKDMEYLSWSDAGPVPIDEPDARRIFTELVAEGPRDGQKVAYKCHKGKKPESPNQDSFSILVVEKEFALYCVYDGHGPCGHTVSNLVRDRLVKEFLLRHKKASQKPEDAFTESFIATQEWLTALSQKETPGGGLDSSMSGTTCTMVYHDWETNLLHYAHVGDSRAVLGIRPKDKEWMFEALTEDHKPNLEKEKKRIEDSGGRVVFDGYYNHRVFSKKGMYPGLNMSRALGDVVGHAEAGLTAKPETACKDLKPLLEAGSEVVLLLCTDGVWEFMENNEAVNMLIGQGTPEDVKALEKNLFVLTKESYDRWMKDSDNEISDDITSIAVIW